jgi:hypothetical protein
VLGLILRIALDARLASWLVGGPWLVGICERESTPCRAISIHENDRWMARGLGEGWSTRGAHGMVATYAWPYVPSWLRWAGPAVLDIPIVSAVVSVRRARSRRCGQVLGCRQWRGQ